MEGKGSGVHFLGEAFCADCTMGGTKAEQYARCDWASSSVCAALQTQK
jgi:hypothetical protein